MRRELYAIRHKPSGAFLPEVNKGYTYSEPDIHRIPRLFEDAAAAKRALTWWLKGIMSVTRHTDEWFEYDERWRLVQPETERKAGDMEVVKVLLMVVVQL